MGYSSDDLIAPAVLYMNPGVTREEFSTLLNRTHSMIFPTPGMEICEYRKTAENLRFHTGLEGLAQLLGLNFAERFKQFQEPTFDDHGLLIRPPNYGGESEGGRFFVTVHKGYRFCENQVTNTQYHEEIKVGDFWEDPEGGFEKGIVQKILKFEQIEDEMFPYNYEIEFTPVEEEIGD
jgi:hypothetical protein